MSTTPKVERVDYMAVLAIDVNRDVFPREYHELHDIAVFVHCRTGERSGPEKPDDAYWVRDVAVFRAIEFLAPLRDALTLLMAPMGPDAHTATCATPTCQEPWCKWRENVRALLAEYDGLVIDRKEAPTQ